MFSSTVPLHLMVGAMEESLSKIANELTDLEIHFPSSNNKESRFWPAISQQAVLSKLRRIRKRFEFIASSHLHQKEDSLVRQENNLLRDQNEALNNQLQLISRRITGIAEAVAKCGFSDTLPCGKLLKQLPPSSGQESDHISLQEVALGRSVPKWAEHKICRYESDPAFRGKSPGELEQQIWLDLPRELQEWVRKPKKEPMGFQLSWDDAMSNPDFQMALCECLQTVWQTTHADSGDCPCKLVCTTNTHWVVRRPSGRLLKIILKEALFKLKN